MTAAMKNMGYEFMRVKLIVNLAPADILGGASLTYLLLLPYWPPPDKYAPNLEDYLVIGELSLDGSLRPIKGALPWL